MDDGNGFNELIAEILDVQWMPHIYSQYRWDKNIWIVFFNYFFLLVFFSFIFTFFTFYISRVIAWLLCCVQLLKTDSCHMQFMGGNMLPDFYVFSHGKKITKSNQHLKKQIYIYI